MEASKLKIVAFGDSITRGSAIGGEFRNWTELVAEETGAEIINAGIGGNTTAMARERFEKDVLSYAPNLVLILFGMNDHVLIRKGEHLVSLGDFEKNLAYFSDKVREIGAAPVLLTPNFFIEGNEKEYYYSRHPKAFYDADGGALAVLDRYIDVIRETAVRKSVPLIDIRKECEQYDPLEFLRTMKSCNANDGVHPARLGVRVYADCVKAYLETV